MIAFLTYFLMVTVDVVAVCTGGIGVYLLWYVVRDIVEEKKKKKENNE